MSLNIKNERTVALVRDLARRTGLSQTSAVEEAVRDKLAELERGRSRDARRARVNRLLADLDQSMTARQKRQIRAEQNELYDDHGLPV
ncbi:antitoxin [Mycobacterium sp. TNTM28]|uniref:Antitoxin n=1 Tax=[Mycobacterium] fortunisiensis TaxID=2600579 RepID=A0ABS6KSY1_9MYCO|nr:type II toxin-antitoxin system VapB family antitoxin [[Mycobacterium] fortunisiensis]MBU9766594.1 antitoxin [[Mycobacterium] fortunisiensis]